MDNNLVKCNVEYCTNEACGHHKPHRAHILSPFSKKFCNEETGYCSIYIHIYDGIFTKVSSLCVPVVPEPTEEESEEEVQ